ncbi:MAG: F0F1 ATP synthase subunit gamma [Bacteroidales bacterium]|nr:F0F1 ATP synthase subunit gamma [Bacteroidales bacterium]
MASLREIKDHIASVRSTLKITSAMKLVASAKLRKAQQAAEGIRPYTAALSQMLAAVLGQGVSPSLRPSAGADPSQPNGWAPPVTATGGYGCERDSSLAQSASSLARHARPDRASGEGMEVYGKGQSVAIVAVASNSSLCGAFNINVIHKVQEVVEECRRAGESVEVISVGRKMAEAMRKAGFAPEDNADLVGRNSFEKSSAFAQILIDAFNAGRYSRVLLIYNHFVSTASQKVCVETFLPFQPTGQGVSPSLRPSAGADPSQPGGWAPPVTATGGYGCERDSSLARHARPDRASVILSESEESDYILEPSREEILATLLPQVMRLRIHTVLLDSIAAEHAARTLAMQAASDNAEDLLGELTLEYNKGRQQKITAEILDLVGGAQQ